MNMVESLEDEEYDTDSIWLPSAEWTAAEVASTAVGFIPVAGDFMSTFVDYASMVYENRSKDDGVDAGFFHNISAFSQIDIFDDCSVSFSSSYPTHSLPEDKSLGACPTLHVSTDRLDTIDSAINACNSWCKTSNSSDGDYSFASFKTDIENNLYESVAFNGTNQTGQFLRWCDAPADLVYVETSTAYPNKGGAIENYTYLSTPGSYPDCELRVLPEDDAQ